MSFMNMCTEKVYNCSSAPCSLLLLYTHLCWHMTPMVVEVKLIKVFKQELPEFLLLSTKFIHWWRVYYCVYLQSVDGLQENERSQATSGILSLGTTKKGIGPCYASKAARQGIRLADLLTQDTQIFEKKLRNIVHSHQKMFPGMLTHKFFKC